MTHAFLTAAGIRKGMRVLDVGCGVGDVSKLVGELVGATGWVLGVDRNPQVVRAARRRFFRRANMKFATINLAEELPAERFDAVVGRLVLMYWSDPSDGLRRLARLVKPGGVVAFQEADHRNYMQTWPPSNLYKKWRQRILDTARICGTTLSLGRRLHTVFADAGLANPKALACFRVDRGANTEVYEMFSATAQSMWPAMLEQGIVHRRAKLPARLSEQFEGEAVRRDLKVCSSRLIGVWSTVP